jgi:serine-type D-Ala-D-Ala endopeptidase (penicillin-binding protein 7)
MFEILVNLMLTSMFLKTQISQQVTASTLMHQEYNVSKSDALEMFAVSPQRDITSSVIGVELTAKSAIVIDSDSDKVLYQSNATEVRSIASLTKLMTALVFLDHNPGWDETIIITKDDYRVGAYNYLYAGEEVTIRDLFNTALVSSANEGAVALARSTGMASEEFVNRMNEKATVLGMVGAEFVEVTGLNTGNRASVTDVARLLQAALKNDNLAETLSNGSYTVSPLNNEPRRIYSTNWILGQGFGTNNDTFRVEAGKTGHLEESGYSFVSRVKNSEGHRVLIAVLGSDTIDDRFNDTKSLAYWAFSNYVWQ